MNVLPLKIVGFVSVALLVASCSHEKPFVDPQFVYAQPPTLANSVIVTGKTDSPLRIGDVFSYNNPEQQWTVTGLEAGKISWKNSTDDFLQTNLSTLLPPIRWGGLGTNLASGWSRLTHTEGLPIELTEGYKFSFTEERHSVRPPDTTVAVWECLVGETSFILVPAGKVEATEVICDRNGREKIMFNYAQSLGHYVRQVIATDNGPVVRELVAYARAQK